MSIKSFDQYLKNKSKKKDVEAFQYLLEDPRGRWLLSKLGFENYLYLSTYTGDADTYKREGSRCVVLKLFDEIRSVGKDELLALMKAEGERHMWIQEQELLYKADKKKGENNND